MGIFTNAFIAMGIGSADVETILETKSVRQGEEINGRIYLQGGSKDLEFNGISLELYGKLSVEGEDDLQLVKISEIVISESFTLAEETEEYLNFSIALPRNVPITSEHLINHDRNKVYLETKLDLPFAVDPTDVDYLEIFPSHDIETIFTALIDKLGFRLSESETVIYKDEILQEFEFKPTSDSRYQEYLDEIECCFFHVDGGIEMFIEIDRRARNAGSSILEMLDMDETHKIVFISNEHLDEGSSHIADLLDDYISKYSR